MCHIQKYKIERMVANALFESTSTIVRNQNKNYNDWMNECMNVSVFVRDFCRFQVDRWSSRPAELEDVCGRS